MTLIEEIRELLINPPGDIYEQDYDTGEIYVDHRREAQHILSRVIARIEAVPCPFSGGLAQKQAILSALKEGE